MRKRFFSIIVCVVMLFTMNVTALQQKLGKLFRRSIAIEELSNAVHTRFCV